MHDMISLFQSIGLSETKANETLSNKKLSLTLEKVIRNGDTAYGSLLYQLASTITKNSDKHVEFIASQIGIKLLNSDQVIAAIKYCEKHDILGADFDTQCGVGIIISDEEIHKKISAIVIKNQDQLILKRYQMLGLLLGKCRTDLRWASAIKVKEELDRQILLQIGPKDERDDPKAMVLIVNQKKKVKKVVPINSGGIDKISDQAQSEKFIFEGELAKLHNPGENPQSDPQLMIDHLSRTSKKVVTRFPPEPNGFLHIGHAKAININFGYAKAHDGITYLRYDDTNPEAEEGTYFDAILDTVKWLGFEPFKITYSSDHFQRLYELAIELISKGKAYVCFCTGEEIAAHRGGEARSNRTECIHRDKSIVQSMEEFQKMKDGEFSEGVAILRMKMDMQNPNPQFWDLVAYRVLYTPHHRTADKWCIYPTYDYTHCLCDSFEDITHSMCTTEFQLSRESYYWLIDALGLYKPVQWEYGRLNLTNTVLSKRKLNELVTNGHVSGWDDPRLYSIASIRRRGVTFEAINAFVRDLGVTTATVTIDVERLDGYIRDHLNQIAPRLFLIIKPLEVKIRNLESYGNTIECLIHKDGRTQIFEETIYIDASDFRVDDDPDFFRLAPGKSVGLLNVPFLITCTGYRTNDAGQVVGVDAIYGGTSKPKTYIQWLGRDAKPVEIRLYNKLFLHANPQSKDEVPEGWLSDLNPDSLEIVHGMCEGSISSKSSGFTFQGVRVGYFCVDLDSTETNLVLNRTVTLKEDSKKN